MNLLANILGSFHLCKASDSEPNKSWQRSAWFWGGEETEHEAKRNDLFYSMLRNYLVMDLLFLTMDWKTKQKQTKKPNPTTTTKPNKHHQTRWRLPGGEKNLNTMKPNKKKILL